MPRKELEKIYNPKDFEERIYQNWEEKGYFTPQIDENKTPYTIVIRRQTLPVSCIWAMRSTIPFRIS